MLTQPSLRSQQGAAQLPPLPSSSRPHIPLQTHSAVTKGGPVGGMGLGALPSGSTSAEQVSPN